MTAKNPRIFLMACAAMLCASAFARRAPTAQKNLDFGAAAEIQIVFENPPEPAETRAAQLLADEILKIKNLCASPQNRFSNAPKRAKIIFRNTRALDARMPAAKLAGRNKYAVEIGAFAVVLEYPSAHKAGWIAGKFLREFCGAEYFSPAQWGAEYGAAALKFKTGRREFEPAYLGAALADFGGTERWRILNGFDTASPFFAFGHNLNKIFSGALFEKSPHLFAMRKTAGGKLARSPRGQPDLLSYQTQACAAEAALQALRTQKMFSIGIADSQEMDERPEYAKYKDGYFRGYPNWSAAVFEFSNEVARRVREKEPNAALGMLAYMICEKPPKFPVAQNLLPFCTTDRANSFLPEYEAEDFKNLEAWGKCGAGTFGIYEYLYGAPYLFARDISAASARAIAKARACGARLYFAESHSIWAYDAKKMWLIARLLETPNADAQKLEGEFFSRYYKTAAPAMREFFAAANRAWNPRKIPPRWLALYRAENALLLLGRDDIEAMRAALERAKAAAQKCPDKNAAMRVGETAAMFALTQSAHDFYASKIEMSDALQAGAPTEKLLEALKKYDALKGAFLRAQTAAKQNPHFGGEWLGLYNTERSAPLDKMAQTLYLRGVGGEKIAALKLAHTDLSAALNAVKAVEKFAALNFSVSRWENFAREFSTMGRDFENASMRAENGALVFRNCELSGIAKSFKTAENQSAVFSGEVKNISAPGTICYASLLFLDARGGELKRKTLVFNSRPETAFTLAGTAPANCAKVNIAVFATRQKAGDELSVKSLRLRVSE